MSSRTCPTCKSDRCGNHAACARRAAANRETNIAMLQKTISELVRDLGMKRMTAIDKRIKE